MNCLVTGSTDGIGLETARQMLAKGYRVLVHGRSEAKARKAAQQLAGAVAVWGDFSRLAELKPLAQQVTQAVGELDVLINNAGVFMRERVLTEDGHETTFQVNHLAHFALTLLLLPSLKKAKQARVVNVSSGVHFNGQLDLDDLDLARGFEGYRAYAASKLANVHFTHELARRLAGTPVVTSALHPGVIGTKLLRGGFGGSGGASLESGARTSVYCATSKEAGETTGRYFSDARETPCARQANDEAVEKKLWELSAKWTGVNA